MLDRDGKEKERRGLFATWFRLKDGQPQSTYDPQCRSNPAGRVGRSIADDDIWIAEVMEAIYFDEEKDDIVKDVAAALEDLPAEDQPEAEPWMRPWDDDAEPDVAELLVESNAIALARDTSTRYAWQVPRGIPYSRTLDSDRENQWLTFATKVLAPPKRIFKRGRPRKGDRKFSPVAEIILWLRGDQLRRAGTLYRDILATVSGEFRISVAMAKRAYDRITRRKNNEPK